LYPEVAENAMSTAFSHIFKEDIHQDITVINEILDADTFDYFKERF
jgi:peptidyl-dipeptidase Dcp